MGAFFIDSLRCGHGCSWNMSWVSRSLSLGKGFEPRCVVGGSDLGKGESGMMGMDRWIGRWSKLK